MEWIARVTADATRTAAGSASQLATTVAATSPKRKRGSVKPRKSHGCPPKGTVRVDIDHRGGENRDEAKKGGGEKKSDKKKDKGDNCS